MKKLLILMLVLGLASAANAVVVQLSFNGNTDGENGDTVNANNTYTVTVSTDFVINVESDLDDIAYDRYIAVYDVGSRYGDCFDVSGFTVANGDIYGINQGGVHTDGGDAGDDASITDPGVPNTLQVSAADMPPEPFNIAAGTQFDWLLHCESDSDVYVDLMLLDYTVTDRILIHQVPEPMTIALLGLGALFLRRRK